MEYLSALNKIWNKVRDVFLFFGVCLLLAGQNGARPCIPEETERLGKGKCTYIMEEHITKAAPDDYDYVENYPYIDYDYIEQYHEVLWHNIYAAPEIDYESTPLAEYLKKYIENDRELLSEEIARTGQGFPLTMDYTAFDFNDDGLEDYMVCYHGSAWSGSGGNHVAIYIQTRNGSLRRVFTVTMRLYNEFLLNAHAPVAVLDEKTDGFYAIVLPGSNRILRYDKETCQYEFQERE